MKPTLLALIVVFGTLALADDTPKPKVQLQEAQKIALNAAKGSVENQDPIVTKGHTDYSFDIKTSKEVRVVVIDGDTGKVISNNSETATELEAKKKKKPCAIISGSGTISGTGTLGCGDNKK